MGDMLTAVMRWIHLTSVVTLIGGIFYARFVIAPASQRLSTESRGVLDEAAALKYRPLVYAAITGLVLSGIYNYLYKTGHSVLYHMLFGIKMLLALHVFSVAILATAPKNSRRARQLFGAAISGMAIILISAYLKGIN
jgi:hypothetical protein